MNEPYFIGAGSLHVSGSFEATVPVEDMDEFARMVSASAWLRRDVRIDYPSSADRYCPLCSEPAQAAVLENAMVFPDGGSRDGAYVTFQLLGADPAAYRAEPCGHRFGRDGKEIAGA